MLVVQAAPERRHRPGSFLGDPAHLRTHMRGLEVNGDATWLDQLDERVRDLLADALLHGEAARVQTHKPRQLRNPDDFWTGDVCDMSDAMEWKCVVLAQRVEDDRALDDLAVRTVDVGRPLARKCRQELRSLRRSPRSRRGAPVGTAAASRGCLGRRGSFRGR